MKTKKKFKFINLTKKKFKIKNKNLKKKYKKSKKIKTKSKYIIKKYKKTKKNIKGGNVCYNFPSLHNCRWCGSMCHDTLSCCLN